MGGVGWVRRRWRQVLAAAFVFLGAVVGTLAWRAVAAHGARHPARRAVVVVVTPGMTARQVGALLQADGVVRSAWRFDLWARLTGDGGRLEAGTYLFRPGTGVRQALRVLVSGAVAVRRLTIPEGWTTAEVLQALERLRVGSPAALARAAGDRALVADAGLPVPPPGVRYAVEGYLYPATYAIPLSATPEDALRMMLLRFRQAATPAWAAEVRRRTGLDLRQAVVLASIVQAEARTAGDMALVAGVYLNRLRRGMPLDADPTVLYGLGLLGVQTSPLTARELASPSPYNTYRHAGLPPGPICNPGPWALEAVADPAPVHALYFLTTAEGRVVLADTLAEQEAHVLRYLGAG